MNRIAMLAAFSVMVGVGTASAQSSEALDSGRVEQQEELANLTVQTAQRVSELEARVEAVENLPSARAEARNTRAARAREIIDALSGLERTMALGQQDVAAGLEDARDALAALSDQAAAEGSRTEAMRAAEALQAVTFALNAVGRSDLFQARSALTSAVSSLSVARDLATAG